MILEQISIFTENKPGTLVEVSKLLAGAEIDINVFTIADTAEFGIIRLLVDAPKKALATLKLNKYVARLTPVVAVRMHDEPGSLAKVLASLAEGGVELEYIYAFAAKKADTAYVVIRVNNPEETAAMMEAAGFTTVSRIDD